MAAWAMVPPVGREHEAERITAVLDALADGRGGALLLEGEGGVGKTTIGTWATAEAAARGCAVLEAAGFPTAQQTPYAVVGSLFGPVLRRHPELADGLRSLGLLFDGLGEPDALDPDLARTRLHGALATVVSRLSAARPVAVYVDDLHWADGASLEALGVLVSDLPDVPLLLGASLRPFETAARPATDEFERRLAAAAWCDRLPVERLGRHAIQRLVETRLGGSFPSAVVDFVMERSGGTPLVAHGLVEEMIHTGALVEHGRTWVLVDTAPVTTATAADVLIGDRLERLDSTLAMVLTAVAIAGEPVTAPVLAGVVDRSLEETARALDELRQHRLVEAAGEAAAGRWVVHHPIIGEVAAARADPRQVAALHRRWYEALPDARLERRGRHLLRARLSSDDVAELDVLVDAGRAAIDQGALTEGCEALGAALDRLEDRPGAGRHVEVLCALAEAWARRNEPEVSAEHARRGLAVVGDDVVARARLVAALHDARWDDPEIQSFTRDAYEEVVAALREAGEFEAAHDFVRRFALAAYRWGEADGNAPRYVEDLVSLADESGRARLVRSNEVLDIVSVVDRFEGGVALRDRLAATLAEVEDDYDLSRRALLLDLDLVLLTGTRDDLLERMRAVQRFTERWGDWPTWRLGMAAADVARAEGDIDAAVAAINRTGASSGRLGGYLAAFVASVAPWCSSIDAPAAPADVPDPVARRLYSVAAVLAGRGSPADTEVLVRAWRTRTLIAGQPLPYLRALGLATVDIAPAVFDDLVEALGRFDGGAGRCSALAAALVARREVDGSGLVEAAEAFAGLGWGFDAAVLCAEAVDLGAEPPGALVERSVPILERASADRALAALDGVRTGVAGPADPLDDLGLTDREREVAEVVAEGLSNREVANRLFISVRTVTSHLDHIYTKLGIGSRHELTALLEERSKGE